jgi:hypothetical protein
MAVQVLLIEPSALTGGFIVIAIAVPLFVAGRK